MRDLKGGRVLFILFAIFAPIVFSTFGMTVGHNFRMVIGGELTVGTYVLFSVLCAAASFIAVTAVQWLAILEASLTLLLAESPGLTFWFYMTIGVPLQIQIAKAMRRTFPAV